MSDLDDMFSGLTNGAAIDEVVDIETMANEMAFRLLTLPPILRCLACNQRTLDRIREALPMAAARDTSAYDLPIVVDETVADGFIEKRYGHGVAP